MKRAILPTIATLAAGCALLAGCTSAVTSAVPTPRPAGTGVAGNWETNGYPTARSSTSVSARPTASISVVKPSTPTGPHAPDETEAEAILADYTARKNIGTTAPNRDNFANADAGALLDYEDFTANLERARADKAGKNPPSSTVSYELVDVLGWNRYQTTETLILAANRTDTGSSQSVVMVMSKGDGFAWLSWAEVTVPRSALPVPPTGDVPTITNGDPKVMNAINTYRSTGQMPGDAVGGSGFRPWVAPINFTDPTLRNYFTVTNPCGQYGGGAGWMVQVSGGKTMIVAVPTCELGIVTKSPYYITPGGDEADVFGYAGTRVTQLHSTISYPTIAITDSTKSTWYGGADCKVARTRVS